MFKDKLKSYLLVLAFGIAMGAAAGLLARFPSDDLWAFAEWASGTLGYWLFSTSVIVLASEKRKTAVINAAIYIFSMFLVTAIFRLSDKYLITYANKEAQMNLFQYLTQGDSLIWILDYMFELETIIAVALSPLLYFGRLDNIVGKIIRILPLGYLVFETGVFAYRLISGGSMLFSMIIDLLCAVTYFLYIKNSFRKSAKKSGG